MKPILVAHATTEGHARKVAEFVAERLRVRGHHVDMVDLADAAAPDPTADYEAAFVGGSLHRHQHQRVLMHFYSHNRGWLGALPLALFSVSLAAAQPHLDVRLEARRVADGFVAEAGMQPLRVCCAAGALNHTEHDDIKRLVMCLIALHSGGDADTDASEDEDHSVFGDVEAFVDEFLQAAGLSAGRARAVAV